MRQSYIGKDPPVGDPPTVEELIAKSKKQKARAGGSGVETESSSPQAERSDVEPKIKRVEGRPSKVAGVSAEALPPTLGELIASGRICEGSAIKPREIRPQSEESDKNLQDYGDEPFLEE